MKLCKRYYWEYDFQRFLCIEGAKGFRSVGLRFAFALDWWLTDLRLWNVEMRRMNWSHIDRGQCNGKKDLINADFCDVNPVKGSRGVCH